MSLLHCERADRWRDDVAFPDMRVRAVRLAPVQQVNAAGAKGAGLRYGSAPWSLDDGKLNDWGGGRGLYFKDPDGHVLELMTVPQ